MGQLGPGTIHRLGGRQPGMSMVVHGVIWDNWDHAGTIHRLGGRQPGMSMVVHGVIWDNWDQGLYTGWGGDNLGCPWLSMV